MAKQIELLFENEEGKTVRISLDEPVEPVDTVALETAMDQILAENAFVSSGGDLVAKKGARIVERNVTDIPLS
ncbi:DUF2922 domain-containing protein [Pseudalkalibacillus salsuginis]|uniref:DUF2922 domain-containing protein n=1 Tax=Pseudalkalibacillus salsuginis TaxID=2910972 RepID=UPI001F43245A|nr:DUF2922 domain-containing protein [Pseudalkalibacillus salsuginis]MCF6409228.1 DUF2922 domain-containing protein [Pseudalkalibacillus salsuginis]